MAKLKYVWLLFYISYKETSFLGAYSSKENVNKAIELYEEEYTIDSYNYIEDRCVELDSNI